MMRSRWNSTLATEAVAWGVRGAAPERLQGELKARVKVLGAFGTDDCFRFVRSGAATESHPSDSFHRTMSLVSLFTSRAAIELPRLPTTQVMATTCSRGAPAASHW